LKLPTLRQEPATNEHHKARWWRQHILGMSVAELSEKTGYSNKAIYRFESGVTSTGKPHRPEVWRRYRLACAALVGAKEDFAWQ
jgi:hypothetical protein